MIKTTIQEPGADKLRDYHRMMFGLMKAKAAAILNTPTIDQLENIKNERQRILPITSHFSSFFSRMNKTEVNSF